VLKPWLHDPVVAPDRRPGTGGRDQGLVLVSPLAAEQAVILASPAQPMLILV